MRWLDVVEEVEKLASVTVPRGRQRHLVRTRRLQSAYQRLGSLYGVVSAEGSFLYLCAEFELAIRTLAEDYGSSLNQKFPRYQSLPAPVQKRNQQYSARILQDVTSERFGSMDPMDVIYPLFTCFDPSTPDHAFLLSRDALSFVDSNFRWKVIKLLFEELGIADLMGAISADASLQAALGVTTTGGVASFLSDKLSDYMLLRNTIVHRRGTRRPSVEDVRQASKLYSSLVLAIEGALVRKFATL